MRPPWHADRYALLLERLGPIKSVARTIYRSIRMRGQHKLLAANAVLRDRHAGKRCLVLGTGVSLNDHDVASFADEWTFGCNDLYCHPALRQMRLDYYVFLEPYYGPLLGRQHVRDVFEYVDRIAAAFRGLDSVFLMSTTLAAPLRRRGLLQDRAVHYLMGGPGMDAAALRPFDLTEETPFAAGALYAMLGAALFMGFTEIYLLGCGNTYRPMQLFHFNARPSFEHSAEGRAVIEAFAREHLLEVMRVDEADGRLVPEFVRAVPVDPRQAVVRAIAEEKGARIFNVTPEGFESAAFEGLSTAAFTARIAKRDA